MLKRVGAETHPCFNPFETGVTSDISPLCTIPTFIPSWKWPIIEMNLSRHLNAFIIAHRPLWQTVSKAFDKSTKVNSGLVLLLAFLLHLSCGEDHVYSATTSVKATLTLWDNCMVFTMSEKTSEQRTSKDFPAIGSRVIPRKLSQDCRLLLRLKTGITSVSFSS